MNFTVFHGKKEKTQMKFSYNRLWKLLIDKGWTKSRLKQETGISSSSIAKLGKGENITTVYRKLDQFTFKEHYDNLPAVMSWDKFGFKKGELAFVAQNYETNKLITILDNRRQTTIRDYFLKYPLKVRQKVQFITMDMTGAYIPLARKLFPNAKIVLDRFHIIQHLGRAFLKTRIAIMNQFDKKSLPYRALKNHWRLFQKDSRKLSLNSFYSKTFRQTLVPHEIIEKTLVFSEELTDYYTLYQLLLFHFQEKRVGEFFELIEENMSKVNHYFQTVFRTFLRHKQYIKNALETDYSNAKLEATNKTSNDCASVLEALSTLRSVSSSL